MCSSEHTRDLSGGPGQPGRDRDGEVAVFDLRDEGEEAVEIGRRLGAGFDLWTVVLRCPFGSHGSA